MPQRLPSPLTSGLLGFFVLFGGLGLTPVRLFAQEGKPAPKEASKKPEPRPSPMLLLASYMSEAHDRIQKAWDVSKVSWVDLDKLHAIVSLQIDDQGKLQKVGFSRASGSTIFDESLLAAVKRVTFAKPPEALVETLKDTGMEILIRRAAFKRQLLPLKTRYTGEAVVPMWEPRQPPPKRR